MVTTVCTVGYGDLNPLTLYERIFCMVLMVTGVSSFTFVSGALSSIISNYDQRQAELQEKLLQLNKLRLYYKLPEALYSEIRQAIRYDANQNSYELENFLKDLPLNLRMEFMMTVHNKAFENFPLFTSIGNKSFINWISSHLRP